MTFAEVVEKLRRSGRHARRASWPAWRYIYVSRKSTEIASGALTVTLRDKRTDAVTADGSPDYLLRWGLKRWQPLLRDLVATDWEVTK